MVTVVPDSEALTPSGAPRQQGTDPATAAFPREGAGLAYCAGGVRSRGLAGNDECVTPQTLRRSGPCRGTRGLPADHQAALPSRGCWWLCEAATGAPFHRSLLGDDPSGIC